MDLFEPFHFQLGSANIPPFRMETIDIPIKSNSQVIEVPLEDLPETCDDICEVLDSEEASLDLYLAFAKVYFLKNNYESYKILLEKAMKRKEHETSTRSLVALLAHIGSMYIRNALLEGNNKKKFMELLEEATSKFNESDRLDSHDILTLLGKGVLLMIKRNFDSAGYHFNLVLEQDSYCFTALNALAVIAFERKEYKEALGYFRKIIKNSSFVPFFVRLGISLSLFYLERYEESEFAFKATLKSNIYCIDAYIYLSHIENKKGTIEGTKTSLLYIKDGLKVDPKNPILLYELASHFFYQKEFVRCHAVCNESLNNANNDECKARCCFLLGRNFHSNFNFDEAFRYYLQAVKLDSSLICASIGLAQCYIFRKEFAHAIEVLEKILVFDQSQYEALKMIAAICHANPKESLKVHKWIHVLVDLYPCDVEGLVIYAATLEQFDPERALDVYLRCSDILIASQLTVPCEIWNNIAVLYERTKQYNEAWKIFETHIISDRQNPASAKFLCIEFNKAFLLEKTDRTDEAISIYTSLSKDYPEFTDVFLRLAWISICSKNFILAEEYLKEASKNDPSNYLVWYHYAYLYQANKSSSVSQERKSYERILSTINKHDLYSLLSIGNIYYRSSRKAPSKKTHDLELGKALDFYQKAILLESHSTFAANGIGICLEQRGYINEAKEIFSQLKQNEINFPDCWVNLAHIHLDSNQYYAALNIYETVQKRFYQEKDPIIFMFMAKCLYCLGREEGNFLHLERAIECLEKASLLEISDSLIKYNLAMCQQELASLKLSLESTKRSTNDLQLAINQIQSAIDIFSQLSNYSEEKETKGMRIYDQNILKTRLISCVKLLENAKILHEKQVNDDLLKQEKLQQLKELRLKRQETEQSKLMEEVSMRNEQEKQVQKLRQVLNEKYRTADEKQVMGPFEEAAKNPKVKPITTANEEVIGRQIDITNSAGKSTGIIISDECENGEDKESPEHEIDELFEE